jgi:hypothetical protein
MFMTRWNFKVNQQITVEQHCQLTYPQSHNLREVLHTVEAQHSFERGA